MRSLTGFSSRWRLLQCLCLVLVFSTILLSTSIESKAQTTLDYLHYQTFNNNDMYGSQFSYDFGVADIASSVNNDTYYEVVLDFSFSSVISTNMYLRNVVIKYGDIYLSSFVSGDVVYSKNHSISGRSCFVAKGSSLIGNSFIVEGRNMLDTYVSGRHTFNNSFTFNVVSCTALSFSEGQEFENGYNAGYSDGENDGYNNGYSQGFLDGEENGFQAGQDSVDTDSYYDAGYQAGYNVAYSDGYNNGFKAGLESAQGSAGEWGVEKKLSGSSEKIYGLPFYVSSYGLVDMEEYQNGSNGYFYNTVPGTYKGISEIRYKMPLSSMNGSGAYVSDSGCTNIRFYLPNVTLNETIDLGGGQTSGHIISKTLNEVYVTYGGKKYYGIIGSNYVNFDFIIDEPVEQLLFSDSNFQVTFVVEHSLVLVTDSDVSLYIGAKYTPYVSFDSFNFFVKPYYKNDRVSANIQDQTDKITGSLDEQKEIQQGQLEEQKEQTETQKGIAASIKEFFGSFFNNLINSIIHVIVPTKEEMGELFNRLNDFFAETFGFLYYPFDFIIDAFNIFLEADSETGLTLPGFSIMGYEVWGNQTYDIASEPIVGQIFGYVRMGTGAMLAMWFVNYLRNFFDKRFGGGGN